MITITVTIDSTNVLPDLPLSVCNCTFKTPRKLYLNMCTVQLIHIKIDKGYTVRNLTHCQGSCCLLRNQIKLKIYDHQKFTLCYIACKL